MQASIPSYPFKLLDDDNDDDDDDVMFVVKIYETNRCCVFIFPLWFPPPPTLPNQSPKVGAIEDSFCPSICSSGASVSVSVSESIVLLPLVWVSTGVHTSVDIRLICNKLAFQEFEYMQCVLTHNWLKCTHILPFQDHNRTNGYIWGFPLDGGPKSLLCRFWSIFSRNCYGPDLFHTIWTLTRLCPCWRRQEANKTLLFSYTWPVMKNTSTQNDVWNVSPSIQRLLNKPSISPAVKPPSQFCSRPCALHWQKVHQNSSTVKTFIRYNAMDCLADVLTLPVHH